MKITPKMENCGFAHFCFAVEARSPYDVVFFPLLDLGLHGSQWFYASRTHISKKTRQAKNIDSGCVLYPNWEYNLLLGGPRFVFLLILESLCRCLEKTKNLDPYSTYWVGISRPRGSWGGGGNIKRYSEIRKVVRKVVSVI